MFCRACGISYEGWDEEEQVSHEQHCGIANDTFATQLSEGGEDSQAEDDVHQSERVNFVQEQEDDHFWAAYTQLQPAQDSFTDDEPIANALVDDFHNEVVARKPMDYSTTVQEISAAQPTSPSTAQVGEPTEGHNKHFKPLSPGQEHPDSSLDRIRPAELESSEGLGVPRVVHLKIPVATWLKDLGLVNLISLFMEHGLDELAVPLLDDHILQMLGLQDSSLRSRLLQSIQQHSASREAPVALRRWHRYRATTRSNSLHQGTTTTTTNMLSSDQPMDPPPAGLESFERQKATNKPALAGHGMARVGDQGSGHLTAPTTVHCEEDHRLHADVVEVHHGEGQRAAPRPSDGDQRAANVDAAGAATGQRPQQQQHGLHHMFRAAPVAVKRITNFFASVNNPDNTLDKENTSNVVGNGNNFFSTGNYRSNKSSSEGITNHASGRASNKRGHFGKAAVDTTTNTTKRSRNGGGPRSASGIGQGQVRGSSSSSGGGDSNSMKNSRSGAGAGLLSGVPPWHTLPGTRFVVDYFGPGSNKVRGSNGFWILTHFHADHYKGLTKSWDKGMIVCSPVTAQLVHTRLRVPITKIREIPLNTPTVVDGVQLTFVDANHCPGAVMVIAYPPGGRPPVLHTGDCRLSSHMQQQPELQALQGKGAVLVLDTTYCNPQYCFPSQADTLAYTLSAVKGETFNPRTLFVFGTYTIGKERLFLEVAHTLKRKVYVSKDKMAVLSCCGLAPSYQQLLTTNHLEASFHAIPLHKVNMDGLAATLLQYKGRYNAIVGIQPTGWAMQKQQAKGSCGRKVQKGTIIMHSVPYSEHSSFKEMHDFCTWLQPAVILPSVGNDNGAARDRMLGLLGQSLQASTAGTDAGGGTTKPITAFWGKPGSKQTTPQPSPAMSPQKQQQRPVSPAKHKQKQQKEQQEDVPTNRGGVLAQQVQGGGGGAHCDDDLGKHTRAYNIAQGLQHQQRHIQQDGILPIHKSSNASDARVAMDAIRTDENTSGNVVAQLDLENSDLCLPPRSGGPLPQLPCQTSQWNRDSSGDLGGSYSHNHKAHLHTHQQQQQQQHFGAGTGMPRPIQATPPEPYQGNRTDHERPQGHRHVWQPRDCSEGRQGQNERFPYSGCPSGHRSQGIRSDSPCAPLGATSIGHHASMDTAPSIHHSDQLQDSYPLQNHSLLQGRHSNGGSAGHMQQFHHQQEQVHGRHHSYEPDSRQTYHHSQQRCWSQHQQDPEAARTTQQQYSDQGHMQTWHADMEHHQPQHQAYAHQGIFKSVQRA